MSCKNTLKKALYISVGAIAVGVECLGEALDTFAEKGSEVVEKGKEMYKDYRAARKVSDDEEPAVVIEEDNGYNEPVPGV